MDALILVRCLVLRILC